MTPRQLSATTFFGIGLAFTMVAGALRSSISPSPPAIAAILHLLSPIGVIFIVVALYRFATKGSSK
jgi:hypothetical protein